MDCTNTKLILFYYRPGSMIKDNRNTSLSYSMPFKDLRATITAFETKIFS